MKAVINTIKYCILALIMLTSCKRERQYSFKVFNNTSYRIDKINVSITDEIDLKVEPYSASEAFSLTCKNPRYNFMTEPLMSYIIENYSDTIKSYKNTVRRSGSVSQLMKESTNAIQIQLRSNPKDQEDFFEVIIN